MSKDEKTFSVIVMHSVFVTSVMPATIEVRVDSEYIIENACFHGGHSYDATQVSVNVLKVVS